MIPNNPHYCLEYLRMILNEYVARHLAFKSGEEDDSEME